MWRRAKRLAPARPDVDVAARTERKRANFLCTRSSSTIERRLPGVSRARARDVFSGEARPRRVVDDLILYDVRVFTSNERRERFPPCIGFPRG